MAYLKANNSHCKHKPLTQCRFNVGPTLNQHWVNGLCLLGIQLYASKGMQYALFKYDMVEWVQYVPTVVALEK